MPPPRYRDLAAPSLIDVGRRSTSTGGEELASRLADQFAGFSRTSSDIGARLMSELGQRQGAEAGAQGAPKMRSSLTAYGKAYNDSALRSYAIRAEADANATAARLETEAGTDPNRFAKAMEEVRRSTVAEAPPDARVVLDEIFTRRTGQGLARIQHALAAELQEEDRRLISEDITQRIERISVLRANDDDASLAEAAEEEAKLTMLIDGAVNTGDISQTEAGALRRTTQRDILFNVVRQRFKNELADPAGDPVSMIETVREVVREDQSLTPEEEAKLEAELFSEIRDHNALRAMREGLEADRMQQTYAAGDAHATALLLSGKLTQSTLLDMVVNDQLTPATARTLANELESGSTAKSDSRELFSVETNLLRYTEDEIRSNQSLSWDDRSRLILKKREDETGWKSTQAAKEAFDRIDRYLGIMPGTDPRLLEDSEKEARDLALTQLYDKIDALPPEERQAALIPASQEVIQTTIRSGAQKELESLRRNRDLFIEGAGDPSDMDPQSLKEYREGLSYFDNAILNAENRAR